MADLARIQPVGRAELAHVPPIDEFRILDQYAGGFAEERPRVPWLATISAGYLVTHDKSGKPIERPYPSASRRTDERWIHMTPEDQERAPGLYAALEAGQFRWLDVALPFDDPNLFLQQRFEKRSATRLEAYGDQYQLTEILVRKQGNTVVSAERRIYLAGSEDYARLVRDCNVSVSLFFALAEWDGRQPRIYFPATDGLGVYRLRFTSRNSLREIIASLRQISSLTGGRLAGIPLRLSLDWRDVADPTGARRTIGVWRLRFMPPEGLKLTPGVWQDLARQGLQQGELLRLPAPSVESIEDATQTVDTDLDQPDDEAVQALEAGPPCDAAFYQKTWFARVKGTRLDSDEARAAFVEGFTRRRTDSLSDFLHTATEEQAAALIAAAGHYIGTEKTASRARRYEEIFGDEEERDQEGVPPGRAIASGRVIDTTTGEVIEDSQAEVTDAKSSSAQLSRAELWAENRRLCAKAVELGVHGRDTLPQRSTDDVIAQANAELQARIRAHEATLVSTTQAAF